MPPATPPAPARPRFYCGLKQILPEGYARFGLPYECMKKGYGACLYHGRLGAGRNNNNNQRFLDQGYNKWLFILCLLFFFLAVLAWVRSFFK